MRKMFRHRVTELSATRLRDLGAVALHPGFSKGLSDDYMKHG